ncbi:class I SAM-dependent methyltransferase [Mycolicibacterium elephantis]|uniref:Methyltransferase type 11 domain-containing protein n=1 Tax=Mycolicibacterium elephantis DSM 44368 TaxID=1335622 RepID=A0A439E020_9MYCO|nr:class I SAM-dependent methyltransferase [Mycolicibacterium elephantis]MCV7221291.1 class I SAM-dependent methyltransferase [Mycolicibacterium elephantis]RWA23731.1 hypothetical protein MELE44368_00585 [Mycolicibacterium elephantis DSM 44368]
MTIDSGPRLDTDLIREVYRRGAEAYDDIWSPVILAPAGSMLAALAVEHARVVLDVGAGTGALTPALRRAAPSAVVLSLDASTEMLAVARSRHSATTIVGDAANLPLPADVVDAVVLAYVLFHLPDPRQALREARRVLRRGGRLGTVTWAHEWPSVAHQRWDEWLAELGLAARGSTSEHAGLNTTTDIEILLGGCGFSTDRVWHEPVDVVFTRERFWRLRVMHSALAVRLAELDPTRRDRVLSELHCRLRRLDEQAFHHRGDVICAVSTRG